MKCLWCPTVISLGVNRRYDNLCGHCGARLDLTAGRLRRVWDPSGGVQVHQDYLASKVIEAASRDSGPPADVDPLSLVTARGLVALAERQAKVPDK